MERDRSLEGYQKHNLNNVFLSDCNPKCSSNPRRTHGTSSDWEVI